MKLIINIPEDRYNEILKDDYIPDGNFRRNCIQAIKNGTPLPKGYGRLIDADKLELDYDWCEYDNDNGQLVVLGYQAYSDNAINTAPTVIEADKENE